MFNLLNEILSDLPWYAWPLCFIYAVTIIYFLVTAILSIFHREKNDEMKERSLNKKRKYKVRNYQDKMY